MKNHFICKLLPVLGLSILLNSCDQNSNKTAYESKSKDSSQNHVEEKLDLTVIQPKSENRRIPKIWKSLAHIQKNWIKVDEDKDGYLIYDPCDGETPTIKLNNGYLYITPQIEPETVFGINKFTRMNNNKGLMIDAYAKHKKEISTVYAEITAPENGLVLWTINSQKMLMTPLENAKNFRQVKNNCSNYNRKELKLLNNTSK